VTEPSGAIDWKAESQRFDGVAEMYDTFRPGYPDELIECILSTSRITTESKLLEVGSGTGIATAAFASRGYSIVCIEPGGNLAAIAARKFQGLPVEFECVRFEDWQVIPEAFDLAYSAQAFHWVPKESGYALVASALKRNGYLALFWNRYPGAKGEAAEDLDQVYRDRTPELAGTYEPVEKTVERTLAEIVESGCFVDIQVKQFPWTARYSTQEYLGLLNTYSDHLRLSAGRRQHLFQGISDVIDRHGAYIDKPYLAVLYLARKRPG
jgi:SAM-dependent methyltransferase